MLSERATPLRLRLGLFDAGIGIFSWLMLDYCLRPIRPCKCSPQPLSSSIVQLLIFNACYPPASCSSCTLSVAVTVTLINPVNSARLQVRHYFVPVSLAACLLVCLCVLLGDYAIVHCTLVAFVVKCSRFLSQPLFAGRRRLLA
ncbi:uncharacterized protein HMPREF1120_01550 [Exophiala dermatitidis NIH/UT8656]|uniref:Uncharacterized protein n=1 Tax=Exophiala dermatitidis (strain ATCC 34100 / CBS 525.76 / NIH/UT8656) TaxID=858893 RepID=H6BSF0_EXODN|nr:uncharacterized protein HMPREF1120_01550 [Exophiala dermatitidis NIH/UT8656]EHY53356.1 hypothetical protein HMPREF1120_01550 [Exophiala dermatitidis NIH/UT8656]